jgi:hypothetical protein
MSLRAMVKGEDQRRGHGDRVGAGVRAGAKARVVQGTEKEVGKWKREWGIWGSSKVGGGRG